MNYPEIVGLYSIIGAFSGAFSFPENPARGSGRGLGIGLTAALVTTVAREIFGDFGFYASSAFFGYQIGIGLYEGFQRRRRNQTQIRIPSLTDELTNELRSEEARRPKKRIVHLTTVSFAAPAA